MTRTERTLTVSGLVSVAVYIGVAWVGARFFGGSVWLALGALLALRAFFGVVEATAAFLSWHLFAKRATVKGYLEVLRFDKFPPRFNQSSDFLDYLSDIQTGEYSEQLKSTAREFEKVLGAIESQGIIAGMRAHAASEAALEAYSPKAGSAAGITSVPSRTAPGLAAQCTRRLLPSAITRTLPYSLGCPRALHGRAAARAAEFSPCHRSSRITNLRPPPAPAGRTDFVNQVP